MKQLWATISDEGGKLGDNFIFLLAMSLENAISLWLISLVLSFKHVISNPRLCFQMTYAVSHSVFLKITYYSHSKVNSSLWYKTSKWELPAGLVVRSQSFHFSSLGSIPGLGTDILHHSVAHHGQKKAPLYTIVEGIHFWRAVWLHNHIAFMTVLSVYSFDSRYSVSRST